MNKKDIYNQLIDIASKLKIRVSEQNLRVTNVNAKSGLCQVKGEFVFIMEKKSSTSTSSCIYLRTGDFVSTVIYRPKA